MGRFHIGDDHLGDLLGCRLLVLFGGGLPVQVQGNQEDLYSCVQPCQLARSTHSYLHHAARILSDSRVQESSDFFNDLLGVGFDLH